MNDIILLKQGEIVLKGLNKKYFEQKLASNAARRIKPFGEAVRAAGGAFEYREYPALPGAWWWDRMWRDDDAFWDWMLAKRSPGEIDPEGAPIPRFLFGGSGQ